MNQPQNRRYIPIKIKLILLIESLVVILVITTGIIVTARERQALENELHKRGVALANDVAKDAAGPFLTEDLAALRRVVLSATRQDYVTQVVLLDNNCRVVMHNDLSQVGKNYEFLVGGRDVCPGEHTRGHYETGSHRHKQLDIFVPITAGRVELGTVFLGYSYMAVAEKVADAERRIFLVALATLIFGGIFAFILAGYISRPIRRITGALKQVAVGDTDVRIEIDRNDEIGILAGSFNQMAHDLGRYRKNLQELVQARTAELEKTNEMLIQEISDRKRAQEALIVSEAKYRNLVDSSLVGIYKTSTAGQIQYANNALANIFEFRSPEDMMKEDALMRYKNPKDRKRFLDIITRRGKINDFEIEVITKNGAYKNILLSGVLTDHEISGMIIDITHRKQFEDQLLKSEEKYRNLFENSLDAIYMTDEHGSIIDVNESLMRLFGYPIEEIYGMSIGDLCARPEDKQQLLGQMEDGESARMHEIVFRKKDGTEVQCLVGSTLRRSDDGSITGYQGIIRDITKERFLEAQLRQAQKMEAVGTLAGGISHDFNNILQSILGYIEFLMMRKGIDHPDFKMLQQVEKSAQRAAELTKRLLVFSRKVESNLMPTDLDLEVLQVQKLLQSTLPKMINIQIKLGEEANIINADSVQLEQIMMNLAVNAKDAMPEGGTLLFETEKLALDEETSRLFVGCKPGEYVVLRISDTGHGMDENTLKRMYEPFFTTKAEGRGTGLGLAMVYGIVKSHGACIRCTSELDAGTVFEIYFPALEDNKIHEQQDKSSETLLMGGNETILLVDDEQSIINQGEEILSGYGYNVVTAHDGESAIDIYKENKEIRLVILDVNMPGMGGHRCMNELRKINPNLKIIIASGYSSDEELMRKVKSGLAEFVAKPYTIAALIKKVRNLLDNQKAPKIRDPARRADAQQAGSFPPAVRPQHE